MILDEVYQAALEAGSGGIRWNSQTKYIQLMDENKNWKNWRYFNTDISVTNISIGMASGSTLDMQFEETGIYVALAGEYNGAPNIAVLGSGMTRILQTKNEGRGRVTVIFGYAGDSVQFYSLRAGYSVVALFFITGYSILSGGQVITSNGISENGTTNLSFSAGQANCIASLICSGGTAPVLTGSINNGVSSYQKTGNNQCSAYCAIGSDLTCAASTSLTGKANQVGGIHSYFTLGN